MPVLYQKMISRSDLKANPTVLYLFGDNDVRRGFGGQAKEIRGEENAVGVRTKARPCMGDDCYWSDQTLVENMAKIDQDLAPVREHLRRNGIVVVPVDGIGTGYSQMEQRCPMTFAYLQEALAGLNKS